MADQESVLPVLQKVTIFAGIDEDRLIKLCAQCRLVEYHVGDTIVKQGSPATEIYILLNGKVKIVLDADKEPLEIMELHSGHCVGEASVIGVQNHSASAIVVEDAKLLELSRKVLMDVSNYDKDLFSLLILNIARELARRLHHTDEILLQFSHKNRGNP